MQITASYNIYVVYEIFFITQWSCINLGMMGFSYSIYYAKKKPIL